MSTLVAHLLRRRGRRRTILALIVAFAAAGACWYVGMDLPHSAAIGLVILAFAVVLLTQPDEEASPWERDQATPPAGVRQDVTRLAWGLRSSRRGVPAAGLRRVRSLARDRLGRHGIALDEREDRAAIARLLGDTAVATLFPSGRQPTLAHVQATLDALDRLARTDIDLRRSTEQ